MYEVVVFLHVLSVLLFMMIHGVSVIVMFVIERQEKPEHVQALLALRAMVSPAVPAFSILILVTGIIAASMNNWWAMAWPGVSVLLFIGIAVVMTLVGRTYFERVARGADSVQALTDLAEQIRSRERRMILAVVGIGGLGIILWLMLFKPF